jgi:transcriptional regulator with XRE-family HTH domain
VSAPPPPTRAHLGSAIRRLRLDRDMTIKGVAEAVGMDISYLSGIENGRRNPSWEKLIDIGSVLGVPLSTIILDSESSAAAEPSSSDS